MITVKIGRSKIMKKNVVVIPKAVREALGLKEGDVIEWHVEEGKIVIKKAKDI